MLAAGIIHPAIDTAVKPERTVRRQRGYANLLCDYMFAEHRYHAAEFQSVLVSFGALPQDGANHFAVFQAQLTAVLQDLTPLGLKQFAIQPEIQPCNIRCVGQFCYLTVIELVKGSRHKQIPLLPRIVLVRGISQAQITVALAHDCLTFAQVFYVKGILNNFPFRCFAIIHTCHFNSLL